MNKPNHVFSFQSGGYVFVMAIISLLLGGCASQATVKGMTPDAIQTTNKHAKSVTVAVEGGKQTDSTGKPQISNAALEQAINDAINNSQTFSKVISGKGADYILTVTVFNLDQPSFGFSFTVLFEAGWTLRRADTGTIVWQESIKSEYTATTTDAFAGVTRLRLATEGAARNNVAKGLSKLSALSL